MICNINKKRETVTLIDENNDGKNITLTSDQLIELNRKFNKEVYYFEDVKRAVEEKILDESLPKEAINNYKYIYAVLENYDYLRNKYCTNNEDAWSWEQCIDEAFTKVDYEDYENEDNPRCKNCTFFCRLRKLDNTEVYCCNIFGYDENYCQEVMPDSRCECFTPKEEE